MAIRDIVTKHITSIRLKAHNQPNLRVGQYIWNNLPQYVTDKFRGDKTKDCFYITSLSTINELINDYYIDAFLNPLRGFITVDELIKLIKESDDPSVLVEREELFPLKDLIIRCMVAYHGIGEDCDLELELGKGLGSPNIKNYVTTTPKPNDQFIKGKVSRDIVIMDYMEFEARDFEHYIGRMNVIVGYPHLDVAKRYEGSFDVYFVKNPQEAYRLVNRTYSLIHHVSESVNVILTPDTILAKDIFDLARK